MIPEYQWQAKGSRAICTQEPREELEEFIFLPPLLDPPDVEHQERWNAP